MDDKVANKFLEHLVQMEDRITKKIDQHYDEFVEFKDGIYNHLDAVIGELKTTREEQSSLSHRTSRLEDRVEIIEKVPVVAHSIKK